MIFHKHLSRKFGIEIDQAELDRIQEEFKNPPGTVLRKCDSCGKVDQLSLKTYIRKGKGCKSPSETSFRFCRKCNESIRYKPEPVEIDTSPEKLIELLFRACINREKSGTKTCLAVVVNKNRHYRYPKAVFYSYMKFLGMDTDTINAIKSKHFKAALLEKICSMGKQEKLRAVSVALNKIRTLSFQSNGVAYFSDKSGALERLLLQLNAKVTPSTVRGRYLIHEASLYDYEKGQWIHIG